MRTIRLCWQLFLLTAILFFNKCPQASGSQQFWVLASTCRIRVRLLANNSDLWKISPSRKVLNFKSWENMHACYRGLLLHSDYTWNRIRCANVPRGAMSMRRHIFERQHRFAEELSPRKILPVCTRTFAYCCNSAR